jgi:hypothetical protein
MSNNIEPGIGKPAFIVGHDIHVAKSVVRAARAIMTFITDVPCPVRVEDLVVRDGKVLPVRHGEKDGG